MVIYDYKFNGTELFDLTLLAFYILVFLLPKRFPQSISLIFILYGISTARFWDQLIGTPPLDFYEMNDRNSLELFDIILYISYIPIRFFSSTLYEKSKV